MSDRAIREAEADDDLPSGVRRLPDGSLEKVCPTCETWKPITEFHKNRRYALGVNYECKSCRRDRSRLDYQKHSEQRKRSSQKWREEHPEELREQVARYQARRLAALREQRAERRKLRGDLWKPYRPQEVGEEEEEPTERNTNQS